MSSCRVCEYHGSCREHPRHTPFPRVPADIEADLLDSQERWTEVRCAYCLAPPRSLCYCRQAYQLGAKARQEAIVAWLRDVGHDGLADMLAGHEWEHANTAPVGELVGKSGAALEADGAEGRE